MFRRKKKDEPTDAPAAPEQADVAESTPLIETATEASVAAEAPVVSEAASAPADTTPGDSKADAVSTKRRGNRSTRERKT